MPASEIVGMVSELLRGQHISSTAFGVSLAVTESGTKDETVRVSPRPALHYMELLAHEKMMSRSHTVSGSLAPGLRYFFSDTAEWPSSDLVLHYLHWR